MGVQRKQFIFFSFVLPPQQIHINRSGFFLTRQHTERHSEWKETLTIEMVSSDGAHGVRLSFVLNSFHKTLTFVRSVARYFSIAETFLLNIHSNMMIKRNYSSPYICILCLSSLTLHTKNMEREKKCIDDGSDEKNGMNSTQLRVFPVEEKKGEREENHNSSKEFPSYFVYSFHSLNYSVYCIRTLEFIPIFLRCCCVCAAPALATATASVAFATVAVLC